MCLKPIDVFKTVMGKCRQKQGQHVSRWANRSGWTVWLNKLRFLWKQDQMLCSNPSKMKVCLTPFLPDHSRWSQSECLWMHSHVLEATVVGQVRARGNRALAFSAAWGEPLTHGLTEEQICPPSYASSVSDVLSLYSHWRGEQRWNSNDSTSPHHKGSSRVGRKRTHPLQTFPTMEDSLSVYIYF